MLREQELETKLASMQGVIDAARQLATESMIVSSCFYHLVSCAWINNIVKDIV